MNNRRLRNQTTKSKKEKENLRRKNCSKEKMIIFQLWYSLLSGVCGWYLLHLKEETDGTGGFNAELPLPGKDEIVSDKKQAYEQEQLSNKREGVCAH